MRFVAFLLTLGTIAPTFATSELVVRSGNNEIRIRTEACTDRKVLSFVKDEYHPGFRKALVKWDGKDYSACWMVLPSGEVLILDETGDHGTIPQTSFKPVAWI